MKGRIRFAPVTLGVIMILLVVWTKDIRLFLFRHTAFAYMVLLFGFALVVYKTLSRRMVLSKVFSFELSWCLTLFCLWIGNVEIQHGVYGNIIQSTMILVCIPLLSVVPNWIKNTTRCIIVLSTIYAVVTIASLVFQDLYLQTVVPMIQPEYQGEMLAQYNSGRIPGLTAHYSTNAIYLGLGSGIMLVYFYTTKKLGTFQKVLLLANFVALLITGKRAQSLFCLSSLIFTYYVYRADQKTGRVMKIALGLAVGLFVFAVAGTFITPLMNVVTRIQQQIITGDILTGRLTYYTRAWDKFIERFLFGWGWRYNAYVLGMDVHNVYLQLLSETGIVGFALFIYVFIKTLIITIRNLARTRRAKSAEAESGFCGRDVVLSISLFIQFFFLQYCFTGNPLYDEQTLLVYGMACAMSYWCEYESVLMRREGELLQRM